MKTLRYVMKEMFLPIILLIRFVEDMKIALTNNPELCYLHALHNREARFNLSEEIIARSPEYSFKYADNVLKGRFELGEKAIAKSDRYSYAYAKNVLKSRFEMAEDRISKNADYSVLYAINILKKRFEIAEDTILKDCRSSRDYLKFLLELDDNNRKLSECSDMTDNIAKGYIGLSNEFRLPPIAGARI